MAHVGGSEYTLMGICTLLSILPTTFSLLPEGLFPGMPRRMLNSQSVLTLNNSQQVANLKPSHTDRQLRTKGMSGNFSGHWSPAGGNLCSSRDISIFQGYEGTNALGIPQYSVQISNNCMTCNPWDIHAFCGWFASAQLVNYNSFQRIFFNDCLVNGGRSLRYGEILRFTYANTKMYPIRVKSASFCRS